jgi:hypothetical protein
MPILYGAVAYREDEIAKYESEINGWDLERTYEHPIACPKGCDKTYRLIVEINASDETAQEYVELVHRSMDHEGCEGHSTRIRSDPPG